MKLPILHDDQMLAEAGVSDPATLSLAYWNGSVWVPMLPCQGCGVDTTNWAITVVADHFTEFAVLGEASTYQAFIASPTSAGEPLVYQGTPVERTITATTVGRDSDRRGGYGCCSFSNPFVAGISPS